MSWQKPARIGVALIGLGSAVAVYLTMGERQSAPPSPPILRKDPKAIIEISGSVIERFIGVTKDFEVKGNDLLTGYYDDGSKRVTGAPVRIIVHKGDSRTVEISGREVKISNNENSFELSGPVKLLDSDGFWLQTDRATVNRSDSIAHVPGAATFGKGRMTGSGVGFSYDEMRQVLLISKQARVKTVDDAGKTVMEMSSGTAMLDRLQHFLTLDTSVHVLRDNQVIDTDAANGRLTANNDVVTYVELHGNARVTGGTSIEAMSARDISLDYTEDGKTLEAVKMAGGATVAMTGEAGRPGRQMAGDEMLDLTLAADGKLTSVMARKNVRMVLPPGTDTPARTVTAQALDGTGQAVKGLTDATFSEDVIFTEQPLPAKAAAAENKAGQRVARAQKLEASMANDAVEAAIFSGPEVTFEETGLKGCAARVEYQPKKDSLTLSGATKGGNPMVAEEQIAIEGKSITVSLETREMRGRGDVQTFSRTPGMRRCRPAAQREANERGASNVPKLLNADRPMIIRAPSLDYNSKTGYATYSGGATLAQDETSIAAEGIIIDQSKGDLSATGKVISKFTLDKKLATGLAHELRYSDAKRLITYSSALKPAAGEVSLVSSPESRLRAGTIELTLAPKENLVDKMKATTNVNLTEGMYTVTGGSTLDFSAATKDYVVKSGGGTPVVVLSREADGCHQYTGHVVTFNTETNNVSVQGGQMRDGQVAPPKAACTPSTR